MRIANVFKYGLKTFPLVASIVFAPYATLGRLFENASQEISSPRTSNKLVFLSPKADKHGSVHGLRIMFPGATILRGHKKNLDEIARDVADHVILNGTIDELVIAADSVPNKILYGTDINGKFTQEGRFTTFEFLDKMKEIQKTLNMQVAKTIVFSGCNVLTDQTPESVRYYRESSRALNAGIVGTESRILQSIYQSAKFVVIWPDGKIGPYDRFNYSFDPQAWLMALETRVVSKRTPNILNPASKRNAPGP